MAAYNSKETYEQLNEALGRELPKGFKETFTGYDQGKQHVGFKPYREKKLPNGNIDVKQGKGGYVKVSLPGHGEVWVTYDGGATVELLGWGNTTAFFEDFSKEDQEALKTTMK